MEIFTETRYNDETRFSSILRWIYSYITPPAVARHLLSPTVTWLSDHYIDSLSFYHNSKHTCGDYQEIFSNKTPGLLFSEGGEMGVPESCPMIAAQVCEASDAPHSSHRGVRIATLADIWRRYSSKVSTTIFCSHLAFLLSIQSKFSITLHRHFPA